MRLLFAVALVLSMSSGEIERAQAVARSRDSERQRFHARYLINLPDPVVPQFEVVTEFRRLVIIAEDHVLRGDWMFTRSVRAAEDALSATRGMITIKAQVRFNPMNTFIESPAYTLAIGAPSTGAPLESVSTTLSPQYSVPFKTNDGRTLSSLLGVGLEASIGTNRIGQTARTIGVMLDGKDLARTVVDFARLD